VEVDERGHVRVGDEYHGTAISAITTIRTTERDVGLPTERDHAGATVTTTDVHGALVDERGGVHGDSCAVIRRRKCDGRPDGPP
jgi:hypothetical protein